MKSGKKNQPLSVLVVEFDVHRLDHWPQDQDLRDILEQYFPGRQIEITTLLTPVRNIRQHKRLLRTRKPDLVYFEKAPTEGPLKFVGDERADILKALISDNCKVPHICLDMGHRLEDLLARPECPGNKLFLVPTDLMKKFAEAA